MKKNQVIYSLRIGALFSFLFILLRFFVQYDFSNAILFSFPLFSVGFFDGGLLLPSSTYSQPLVTEEKWISSLIYPLLVNVILWLPFEKVYHSVYGMLWVEKWKAFSCMITCILLFLISLPNAVVGIQEYLWGFFISIIYYSFLRYHIELLKKNDILAKTEGDLGRGMYGKKILAISLIHLLAFFSLIIESELKVKDERTIEDEISIPESFIIDISENGEEILLLREQKDTSSIKEKYYEVSVINMEGETIWKKEGMKYHDFFELSKNRRYVYMVKNTDEKIKILDLNTGNIIKSFALDENSIADIEKIEFSKNDLFFSIISWGTTIWDYESEDRVASYEYNKGKYRLVWTDRNSYILFRKHELEVFYKFGVEISWNQILPDGNIKKEVKEKISEDMNQKMKRVEQGPVFVKDINQKLICTVVGGGNSSLFSYMSYMDFWDVENEKKIFSLTRVNEILDVVFFPEKDQFLLIERMRNQKIKISFWNLKNKKEERVVFLKGVEENRKKEEIKVIKDGEYMVVFWSNHIRKWKIK